MDAGASDTIKEQSFFEGIWSTRDGYVDINESVSEKEEAGHAFLVETCRKNNLRESDETNKKRKTRRMQESKKINTRSMTKLLKLYGQKGLLNMLVESEA